MSNEFFTTKQFLDAEKNTTPWAMQLAFLVDKNNPASKTAICEAAAKATVSLLASPNSEWAEAVHTWKTLHGIRKVVRRGKSAHFARASHLPGVLVEHAGASVKAFPPATTSELPADLSRLQVSGSEPPELGTPTSNAFVNVVVNPDVTLLMSTGKTAAQVSHAAQLAYDNMDATGKKAWESAQFSVSVSFSKELWEEEHSNAQAQVRDAGHTEVPFNTLTCVAYW